MKPRVRGFAAATQSSKPAVRAQHHGGAVGAPASCCSSRSLMRMACPLSHPQHLQPLEAACQRRPCCVVARAVLAPVPPPRSQRAERVLSRILQGLSGLCSTRLSLPPSQHTTPNATAAGTQALIRHELRQIQDLPQQPAQAPQHTTLVGGSAGPLICGTGNCGADDPQSPQAPLPSSPLSSLPLADGAARLPAAKVWGVLMWAAAYGAVVAYHALTGISLIPFTAQANNLVWEVVKPAAMSSSRAESLLFALWPLAEVFVIPTLWESGDLGGVPLGEQRAEFVAVLAACSLLALYAASQGRKSTAAVLYRQTGWINFMAMAAYAHEHMAELCAHGPMANALIGAYMLGVAAGNVLYAAVIVRSVLEDVDGNLARRAALLVWTLIAAGVPLGVAVEFFSL